MLISKMKEKQPKMTHSFNLISSSYSSINASESTYDVCLTKIQQLKETFYQTIDQQKHLLKDNSQLKNQLQSVKKEVDHLLSRRNNARSPRPGSIIRTKQKNLNSYNSSESFKHKVDRRYRMLTGNEPENDSYQSIYGGESMKSYKGGNGKIQKICRLQFLKIDPKQILSPRIMNRKSKEMKRASMDIDKNPYIEHGGMEYHRMSSNKTSARTSHVHK